MRHDRPDRPDRREMIRATTAAVAGGLLLPLAGRTAPVFASSRPASGGAASPAAGAAPHRLPDLPYALDALEPYIDARTMEIHHGRHHAAYVANLNRALEGHAALQAMPLDGLIADLSALPESIRTAVRNNGGGHHNHALFWTLMRKGGGGEPKGALADAIVEAFGSFGEFKAKFAAAAMSRFGSGWAWLTHRGGRLAVESTANQDSPVMDGGLPILGLDVWEHAYYLKYQNRRGDYVEAWWNVVDWDAAARQYELARA
jgi:superoxide dismutase, Fe-Mn family